VPRKGWKSVSLPESLVKEIDHIIQKNPSFWKSRADLVTYAVRRLLELQKPGLIQIQRD